MKYLRTSYSMLSAWSWGKKDDVIKMLKHEPMLINKAMEVGKRYHKLFEQEVIKTKRLPREFGNKELTNPKTEVKIEKWLDEWLQLVGVIDLIDGNRVYDYKIGHTPSQAYANTFQLPIYGLLYEEAKEGYILHYNPVFRHSDWSVTVINSEIRTEAIEWVITFASEIYDECSEYLPEKV